MGNDMAAIFTVPGGENKNPIPDRHGEHFFTSGVQQKPGRSYTRPSIAFHKGSFHYVQRVRMPHRGQSPSSATQLPILTALHARFPTLFVHIIQQSTQKVNPFLKKIRTLDF